MNITTERQIIIGRAGSGKTTRLIKAFEEGLRQHGSGLSASHYFLVPTVEHAERVKDIIMANARTSGYMNLKVMTFDDFMSLIEERYVRGRALSPMMKQHILRGITAELSLDYYATAQMNDGFAGALGEFLSEIKVNFNGLAALQKASTQASDPLLRAKLRDIYRIAVEYDRYLREHDLADHEDLLLQLVTHALPAGTPPFSLFIDGFFDFSEAQYVFLAFLERFSKTMTITLTTDPDHEAQELFTITQTTLKRLRAVMTKAEIIRLPRHARPFSPTLMRLEHNIFAPKKNAALPAGDHDALTIVQAKNARYEVRWIADEIKRCITSGRYSVHDIALIFRSCTPYIADIRAIFTDYKIPFDIHERERLSQSPLIKSIVGLVELLRPVVDMDALIRHLRSSHTRHDDEGASELERSFRRYGWEGTEKSLDEIVTMEALPEEMRAAIVGIKKSHEVFAKEAEVAHFNSGLKAALIQEGIVKPAHVSAYAPSDLYALMRFEEILAEMEGTFMKTMNGQEYLDLLRDLIDVSLYSVKNTNANAVQIYNIGNAKQKEYKVVFLCGLLEGTFPAGITEDILVKDDEREDLIKQGITIKRFKDRIFSEKYLFYLALTRAVERLFLTYPGFDDNGRELFPSNYLMEVRHCFAHELTFVKERPADLFPPFERVMHKETLKRKLIYSQAENTAQPFEQHLLAALFPKEVRARLKATAVAETRLTDKAILAACALHAHPFSATKLQAFEECPYKYFLEHKVNLKVPEELCDDKIRGTITHAVLERFYRQAKAAAASKSELIIFKNLHAAEEQVRGLFAAVVEEEKLKGQERTDVRSALQSTLNTLLALIATEAEIEKERLTMPTYFEYAFGKDDVPGDKPFKIVFENGKWYEFCGVIDRIDLNRAGTAGIILDYKGARKLTVKEVKEGDEIQLLLYAKFVRERLGKEVLGLELYPVRLRERSGVYLEERVQEIFNDGGEAVKKRCVTHSEFMDCEKAFLGHVLTCIERLLSGDIRIEPAGCTFCDLSTICRCDKWSAKLKAEDDDE
jgi:ATP-dependent helicase/nuclease subunit B